MVLGGAAVAMAGKNCVAIACDLRLGMQGLGVSANFEKIFEFDNAFLGLTGLATDVLSVSALLKQKVTMYKLQEERSMEPQTFANLVSTTLYSKRFGPYFCAPVIAGLNSKTNEPFLCTTDLIGAIEFSKDFVVGGTATDQLYGMCESLFEPDLEPEDLFETISQALMNAVDRDPISGWGAVVYIITKDKVIKRLLKTRMD